MDYGSLTEPLRETQFYSLEEQLEEDSKINNNSA